MISDELVFKVKFVSEVCSRDLRLKMPKSISSIKSQIETCERNMQECLAQCDDVSGGKNFEFSFSLKKLLDGISTCDVDETLKSIKKVETVFEQCERLMNLERRRHQYKRELNEKIQERERKETVKRLTQWQNFKRKALAIEIPSTSSSEEMLDD